jgi:hypothetical protein
MLVWATTRTARSEFAIDNNGWHTPNAVFLGFRCYFGFVHVVDDDLMRGASYSLDEFYSFYAR